MKRRPRKRRPGRPRAKHPLVAVVGVRLEAGTLRALDRYRKHHGQGSRGRAARSLLEWALHAWGYPNGEWARLEWKRSK